MSELDLEAIRRRVTWTTPGPWYADTGTPRDEDDVERRRDWGVYTDNGQYKGTPEFIADTEYSQNPEIDAEFIAHARQDVLALIARVEELEKEVAFLKKTTKAKRQGITPATRYRVLHRDNFACRYCGARGGPDVPLEIDHHVPVAKGGDNSEVNLWTACFECNRGKRDSSV